MTTPANITDWLLHPANFSDNDRKSAAALLKAYPYLVPARYVEAAEHHKVEPFATAMINSMQLYMGNWLLFHEFMQQANASGAPMHSGSIMQHHELDEDDDDFTDFSDEDSFDEMDLTNHQSLDFESFNEEDEDEDDLLNVTEDTDDAAMIHKEEDKSAETFFAQNEPKELPKTEKITEEKIAETPKKAEQPAKEPEAAVLEHQPEPVAAIIPPVIIEEKKKTPKPELVAKPVEKVEKTKEPIEFYKNRKTDSLIQPIYTEDYFLHQGIPVSEKIPAEADHQNHKEKSLMVVMSFSEWLIHFKTKGEREKEEQQDQKALKTMWQKEKLAAALEEENEEIPENVFEMAVNSITKEDDLASESLAEIMMKQGKYDKAIDMYRKLSLRNPQKSTYFARKIDDIQKEKS